MNFLVPHCAVLALVCAATSATAGDVVLHINNTDGQPMPGVVVEVISPRLPVPDNWTRTGVVDQVGKEFVEPVIAVVENSVVSFPNSDDIHHHVYSFSETKRFELPLYTGNTAEPVQFDKPGVATIGCNIHDWMVGYVYVGQTHLMAVTNQDGMAAIPDIPEGSYTLSLWHAGVRPGQDLTEISVTVEASGVTEQNLTLQSQALLPIRRAPLPGLRNY